MKPRLRDIRGGACLLLMFAIEACDVEGRAWEQAQSLDSLKAYNSFLVTYPDSSVRELALSRISSLEDEEWASRTVERKIVVAFPESVLTDKVTISDDGSNYAFAIKTDKGQRIVHNGDEHAVYDRVSKPRFSPGSNKLFYWALVQSRRKEGVLLIADGREISTGLNGEGSLWFSPGGTRWAVVGGTQGNPITLIVDGEITREYSDVSYPTFSNDGTHMAILVRGGLVVDNERVTNFSAPEVEVSMEMSAYVTGPNMPPLHKIMYLSTDSLLYLTKESEGWTVFLDETRLASYRQNIWGGGSLRIMSFKGFDDAASILPSSLNMAADAPFAIWWERPDGPDQKWRVVRNGIPVDGIVSNQFWDRQKPVLSDNGERWAYPAYIDDDSGTQRIFMIVDGEKHGPYAHVWGMTFSGDSSVSAYSASNGEDEAPWKYFVDGEALPDRFDSLWPIKLSHDGRHYTWKAKRNDQVEVAIDGIEEYKGEAPINGPMFLTDNGLSRDSDLPELITDNGAGSYQSVNSKVVWYTIEQDELIQYIR